MKYACNFIDLGTVGYRNSYCFQRKTVDEVKLGLSKETIIFCEHLPVITLGRTGKMSNLLAEKGVLEKESIEFFKIDRGGDITAHEPGQLTVYPILNLKQRREQDIRFYLTRLQNVALALFKEYNISAKLVKDKTGVWVKDEKIASIGIGITHWITYHGLSINIKNDLKTFSYIRPCGMDVKPTSMAVELDTNLNLEEVKICLIKKLQEIFQLEVVYEKSNIA
jgi:lipoate-protein ligase B